MKKSKFLLILNSFWAIPLVLILRIINKFKKICIVKIRSDRFGHFAPDGAEQVARSQMKKKKITFYIFDWYVCNKQWAKMLSQALPVYNCLRPVYFWNDFIPGGREVTQTGTETISRDIELLYTKYNVKLPFNKIEDLEAITWMESKGWKKGEPFYCIMIRDSAYLNTISNFKNNDWSYHNYRNSKLDTYHKSISWLVNQGVWVIRMGKIVSTPLKIKNKKIIDFPFENKKSDLIDTWLFANCDGCISTGTGPDLLSGVYDKNILFLNYLPLFGIRSDLKSITYPKTLIWGESKKHFTMDEYIDDKRVSIYDYETDGVKIIDMTEDEILEVTKEFHYYNIKKYKENNEYKKLQQLFWKKIIVANKKFKTITHSKIHPESNASVSWLKKIQK